MKKSSINFSIFENNKYKIFYNSMKPYADILSENEIRFKYIRNQYLENERYDELMNNLIISAGKNINEFSKNVWMVDKDIKNLNENGHIVGLHSFRHPYVISKLSYE